MTKELIAVATEPSIPAASLPIVIITSMVTSSFSWIFATNINIIITMTDAVILIATSVSVFVYIVPSDAKHPVALPLEFTPWYRASPLTTGRLSTVVLVTVIASRPVNIAPRDAKHLTALFLEFMIWCRSSPLTIGLSSGGSRYPYTVVMF